jgi:hypothetical protein
MLAGKCPLKDRLDPVGLLLICVNCNLARGALGP